MGIDADGHNGLSATWIAFVTVTGASVVASSLAVEDRWGWVGVAPGVLANIGTGILLAAVLFLAERRFTRRVTARTEALVRDVETRGDERARQFETRMDELENLTLERLRERESEADATVQALDDVSFETVTNALATASRARALATAGVVRVQASTQPDGLRISFAWGRETGFGETSSFQRNPVLVVRADIERRPDELGTPVVEVEWRPEEAPAEVGADLVEELRRAGRWEGHDSFDWALAIRNLRRTLDVGLRSQRREIGAWNLHGKLFELMGRDWALTEAGIERRNHGVVAGVDVFPGHSVSGSGVAGRFPGPRDWEPPPPPTGVDPLEWRYLIAQGRSYLPQPPAAMLASTASSWEPELGVQE